MIKYFSAKYLEKKNRIEIIYNQLKLHLQSIMYMFLKFANFFFVFNLILR